jgi:hypothetical protein
LVRHHLRPRQRRHQDLQQLVGHGSKGVSFKSKTEAKEYLAQALELGIPLHSLAPATPISAVRVSLEAGHIPPHAPAVSFHSPGLGPVPDHTREPTHGDTPTGLLLQLGVTPFGPDPSSGTGGTLYQLPAREDRTLMRAFNPQGTPTKVQVHLTDQALDTAAQGSTGTSSLGSEDSNLSQITDSFQALATGRLGVGGQISLLQRKEQKWAMRHQDSGGPTGAVEHLAIKRGTSSGPSGEQHKGGPPCGEL